MPGVVLGLLIAMVVGIVLWRSRQRTRQAFADWRRVIAAVARDFDLDVNVLPETYAALRRRHLLDGASRVALAQGHVGGRRVALHSLMIGDALATELETETALAGVLEGYTCRSDAAVLGLGPLLLSSEGRRVDRAGLLLIAADTPDLPEPIMGRIAALLGVRPHALNLSRQLRPFWSKAIRIERYRARLIDYGLVRDEAYAGELLREFLAVIDLIEGATVRPHSAA